MCGPQSMNLKGWNDLKGLNSIKRLKVEKNGPEYIDKHLHKKVWKMRTIDKQTLECFVASITIFSSYGRE